MIHLLLLFKLELILFHLMNSMVSSLLMSSVLSSIRLLLQICPFPLQIWQHVILLLMVMVVNLAKGSPPTPMVAVEIEVVVVGPFPPPMVMVHPPLLGHHVLFVKSATSLVMLPSPVITVLTTLINLTIQLQPRLKLSIALRQLLMITGILTLVLLIT